MPQRNIRVVECQVNMCVYIFIPIYVNIRVCIYVHAYTYMHMNVREVDIVSDFFADLPWHPQASRGFSRDASRP